MPLWASTITKILNPGLVKGWPHQRPLFLLLWTAHAQQLKRVILCRVDHTSGLCAAALFLLLQTAHAQQLKLAPLCCRVDHTSDLCAAALFLLLRTASSLRSIVGTELWQDLDSRWESNPRSLLSYGQVYCFTLKTLFRQDLTCPF